MKNLILALGTILAILVITVFPCYAQGNVIYGCYQKNEGQLRIVKSAGECRPSEIPISWNKIGPPGPPGSVGIPVPNSVTVDCSSQTISQALRDIPGNPLTITVKGTCNENVVIARDDVTLIADPSGATVNGPDPERSTIMVQGARRVFITGVTVSGARNGVVAYQGGSLTLENSTIQNNARIGVIAILGSSATVNSCAIQNNAMEGVVATDSSALFLTNSTIQGNGRTGVVAARASSARIGRTILGDSGPNTIKNNGGSGVTAWRSSFALIDGNTIENNSSSGVYIEGASGTVTKNTIRANQIKGIEVGSSGNARIGITDDNLPSPNTIESNIYEGIQISNSAAVYMLANLIQSNGKTTGRPGVGIYRATGRLIGDNTIEGNGGHGVEVVQGALFQGKGDFFNLTPGPDTIQGNTRSGISAFNNGTLDIEHAKIMNNTQNGIALSTRSTLRIYDSTISDNGQNGIGLDGGSAVVFFHPTDTPRASVTGNSGWGYRDVGSKTTYFWPADISTWRRSQEHPLPACHMNLKAAETLPD